MRLSSFAGEPRYILLGGQERLASKLRIRDVAYLECWIEEIADSVDEADRPSDQDWPPSLDSSFAQRLLATQDGIARVVYVSLRQISQVIPMLQVPQVSQVSQVSQAQSLTLQEAATIAGEMTLEELQGLWSAISPEPMDMSGSKSGSNSARRMDWVKSIRDLINVHHWLPDDVLDMNLDQFFAMFGNDGQAGRGRGSRRRISLPDDAVIPIRGPEDIARIDELRRAYRERMGMGGTNGTGSNGAGS